MAIVNFIGNSIIVYAVCEGERQEDGGGRREDVSKSTPAL